MKEMKNGYGKQKGIGIVEILATLAIIALIIAYIVPLLSKGNDSATLRGISDDFRLLDRMVIETRGPGSINITGLTLAEVTAADKKRRLSRDDGAGGFDLFVADTFEVTNLATATTLSTNDSYAATIDGFDDQICSDAVRNLWPLVDQVSINGTSVKANSSVTITSAVSTAISTNCSELETNGTANALVLTKRING